MTWELKGKYPGDLRRPERRRRGTRSCSTTPRRCSTGSSPRSCSTASGVYGFFPANSDGDDIVVYTDETRTTERARFPMLRQQWEREGQNDVPQPGRLHRAASTRACADYLGAFAVTAGIGVDELVARVRARPRRLQRDHGQGPGRPPGRGVRRDAAPAAPAATGATAATSGSRPTT